MRADIQAERLAVAAGKFAKAARIFDGTVREISAVPRPPRRRAPSSPSGSATSSVQESYLGQIAAALRAEHIVQSQHNAARFVHNGNLANDVVIAFGFNYCSFKFSRFG